MTNALKVRVAKTAVVSALAPALILAFARSVPAGHTGAPGESPTPCLSSGCHSGAMNPPGGQVEIALPEGLTYIPGVKQRWLVTISDPDTTRKFGFQAAARIAANNSQAGTFASADAATATVNSGPLQYIYQTASAAAYSFDWTPPASETGEIKVYVAGAAARSRNTTNVYTATYTLRPAGGRPAIDPSQSALNAASLAPGFASGTWVAVKGSNLSTITRTWDKPDFTDNKLPTQLDGVGVSINGKPAFVYFISPAQINVLAPEDAAEGPVTVEVITPQGRSDPAYAAKQKLAPAWFLYGPAGSRYIAGVHPDGTYLGKPELFQGLATSRPAKPGDVILLFGTGFGAVDPAMPDGEIVTRPGRLTAPLNLSIGGMPAVVEFAGLVQAGLYQFNLKVPDLPDGDNAVVAEIGGLRTQDNTLITVGR